MSPRPGRIVAEIDVPFPYPAIPTCASTPSSPRSAPRCPTLRAGGPMSFRIPTIMDADGPVVVESPLVRTDPRSGGAANRGRPSCHLSSCSAW